MTPGGVVAAVSASATHTLSKPRARSIRLVAGLGIDGDAHAGVTVNHRSRVCRDPTAPALPAGARLQLGSAAVAPHRALTPV